MSDYLEGIINKEGFDIADKIGISEIIEVYTDKYPLLRPKKIYNGSLYQKIDSTGINLVTPLGYDFLDLEYITSYLNLPISIYNIYLNFSSVGNLYYDTVSIAAISGSFEENAPIVYTTDQTVNIGKRTRFKIANTFGISMNIPAIEYSGDMAYNLALSGSFDSQLYLDQTEDYFINESIENGEVILRPAISNSINSYNLISDNYPYNLNDTHYVQNIDLIPNSLTSIIIDDLGNNIPIYYSGFDNLSLDIPFYVGDNDKYFKIYKQDGISSGGTRVKLIEDTNYKIDYANGKIRLYDTLNWNSETELWIESYFYDKIYYKYIESARIESGDTDSENYQFSHTKIKKMFHKALQKILFWIPYNYDYDDGYISPRLDEKMIDFVGQMCNILILQGILNNSIGSAIYVRDGSTVLDLSKGLGGGHKVTAMQLKELKEKLRSDITDYCINEGYFGLKAEGSQGTSGLLW